MKKYIIPVQLQASIFKLAQIFEDIWLYSPYALILAFIILRGNKFISNKFKT